MLSRHPTGRICSGCSYKLLETFAHRRANTHHSRIFQQTKFLTVKASRKGSNHQLSDTSRLGIASHEGNRKTSPKTRGNKRLYSTTVQSEYALSKKEALFGLIDKVHEQEEEIVRDLQDLDLIEHFPELVYSENLDLVELLSQVVGYRSQEDLEARVRLARQQFGESLPEEELNEEELGLYTKLYGEPFAMPDDVEQEPQPDKLFRDDGDGGLTEVQVYDGQKMGVSADLDDPELGMGTVYEVEEENLEDRVNKIAEMLGGEVVTESAETDDESEDHGSRAHPLTTSGKFSTGSRSISLPLNSMVAPVTEILSLFPKKHVAEVAHKTFGGPHLPHSTSTPPRLSQQQPIPLEASQRYMTDMEANAYIAALYPGTYASVLSALVEVRKRLGSEWLRGLISKEGGPRILDASAGGAGVLAWREVLKAEWSLMSPDHPETSPIPFGKSTVVTGSDSLRHRASILLENTTFLPRLPDYVHARDNETLDDSRPPPKRKQFDVVIAPHSLWQISDDYLRKAHVQNLWSLLNPEGGILILLEKGTQRGFEAVAGAREMILNKIISSPGSTEYETLLQSPGSERFQEKEKGTIIAPCTNHVKCPMYTNSGEARSRKDFCHFEQRFTRPKYLQYIKGAKEANHEDIKFSYLAVQRGIDLRETRGIAQGQSASDAAFAGYEELPSDQTNHMSAASPTDVVDHLTLPRIIFSPIKRKGHVTMDLCTPGGKMERWTVPRSFSKQAYRDARKSAWGDIWALGAKSRQVRNLRLGTVEGNTGHTKRDRQTRKLDTQFDAKDNDDEFGSALENSLAEEGIDIPDLEGTMSRLDGPPKVPKKKKGKNIPSWLKKVEKKRARRAGHQEVEDV